MRSTRKFTDLYFCFVFQLHYFRAFSCFSWLTFVFIPVFCLCPILTPGCSPWTLDIPCWILDILCRLFILTPGCSPWILDIPCWILDILLRLFILTPGCSPWTLDIPCWILDIEFGCGYAALCSPYYYASIKSSGGGSRGGTRNCPGFPRKQIIVSLYLPPAARRA